MEGLHEELEISNLDPKDAHTKFVARVNSLKMVRIIKESHIIETLTSTTKNADHTNIITMTT
jgi:hypothetical protein